MRQKPILFSMLFLILLSITESSHAEVDEIANDLQHNWQVHSTDYSIIDVGSHEYTYWKNFIRHKRTCYISHEIKTVIYYCDIHDHTKTKTFLERVIHSENHRD